MTVVSAAQAKNIKDYNHFNQVRLGIGDMLFETMIWHNQEHKDYTGAYDPQGKGFPENSKYRYTPHFSVEYTRRLLPWLCVGGTLNIQGTLWEQNVYSNENKLLSTSNESFYNLCIMPLVRFHYFRRPNVELYSAVAAGIDINGGTQKNAAGKRTVCGMSTELTFIGVMAGKDHWYGFFDLGALIGMKDKNNFYMFPSQMLKLGVAYVF